MKDEIDTVQGKAKYIKTEVENSTGKFNDSYFTSDGFFLIHDGINHYVYKVKQ